MKRPIILSVATCLAATVPQRKAEAEPHCAASLAPSAVSIRDTGLDRNRVACGASGFRAGTRAFATIDTPNFYGTLSGALFLDYRLLTASGFEFSAGARFVDYRFAQSAVFTDGEFSVGPISLGVLRPQRKSWWGVPVVSSHGLRFELPLTNSSDQNITVSASPTALVTMMPSSQLHLHGRLAGLLWSTLPESGADSRAALIASTDVAYAPVSFLAATAGVEAQGGWYGLGLDHLIARGGLNIPIGDDNALQLSIAHSFAGAERADMIFWLGYQNISVPDAKPRGSRLRDWATSPRP